MDSPLHKIYFSNKGSIDEAFPNLTGFICHPSGGSGKTSGSIQFSANTNQYIDTTQQGNPASWRGQMALNTSNQYSIFKDNYNHITPSSLSVVFVVKY